MKMKKANKVKTKQQVASLDDVLLRMKQVDKSLLSGEMYHAMSSAVKLHPLNQVLSEYKETPAKERCKILLQAYSDYLKSIGVKDAVKQAYHNFATAVGHNPSTGTTASTRHYRTWRPVLDNYQQQHNLERVSWFNK